MQVKIEVSKEVVKTILSGGDYIMAVESFVTSIQVTSAIADQVKQRNEGKARKKRLRALGFDMSTSKRVRCSQCEATAVNGIPCHEHGCSNDKR